MKNIKGLHHQVENIKGLENLSLWQGFNFFSRILDRLLFQFFLRTTVLILKGLYTLMTFKTFYKRDSPILYPLSSFGNNPI